MTCNAHNHTHNIKQSTTITMYTIMAPRAHVQISRKNPLNGLSISLLCLSGTHLGLSAIMRAKEGEGEDCKD